MGNATPKVPRRNSHSTTAASSSSTAVPPASLDREGLAVFSRDMETRFRLRPLRYNTDHGRWEALQADHVATDGEKLGQRSALRLVTYNVFFGAQSMRQRFRNILAMLAEIDADVVCLQEANQEWMEEMSANEFIRKTYYASDVTGQTLNRYGVVLLSRFPMIDLSLCKLPTNMGRLALVSTYKMNDEKLAIGTVHLESLDSAQLRKVQLEKISDVLKDYPHAGLMGDFNFDSDRNFRRGDEGPLENDSLAEFYPDYVDVWPTLHPGEKGYTFDSEVNRMIRQYEQMRYDRIVWRSSAGKWKPTRIEMIGTRAMKGEINVWPSDHFGLMADLEFVATSDGEEEKAEE